MKKVYQTKFGSPDGNCFAACVASILEIGIDEVPDFKEGNGEWYQKYKQWLRNYAYDFIAIKGFDSEDKDFCPHVYSIVGGTSPRGLDHAVVYFGMEMVHDPHPDGGGITDIQDWIYFVPMYPNLRTLELMEKLVAADKVMRAIDKAVEGGNLDARIAITDLRLNYGEPFKYEFDGVVFREG